MKLNELFKETTESGSALTTTDNFDIIPKTLGITRKNPLTRRFDKKSIKKKKKKKRKKVDINWGPDAYAPYAGE